MQSVVHVLATEGDIEIFDPPHSLIKIPKKNEEDFTSFRRRAEELVMDMSKWTDCTPFIAKSGHKHYKNVSPSGGVAYLSVGTVKVSAKLATELLFKAQSTPEMYMNGLPPSFKAQVKLIKQIDENTFIIENKLKSPGGPCHAAHLLMRDPTGGAGFIFQCTILKAPPGAEILPNKTIDSIYKQAYGMVAFKFTPIKGREGEALSEFRFMHQWWENKGHSESADDQQIIDSKDIPAFVAELIFRKQIQQVNRLAGLPK
jgi:hypothetical protein